jgi:Protein of unknown function (DUF3016)
MNTFSRSPSSRPSLSGPLRTTALSVGLVWMGLACVGLVFAGDVQAGKLSDRIVRVTEPNAPRSLPEEGRVAVQWTDPAKFSELRGSGNRSEAQRGDWVTDLARYLRKSAERRLPGDERLEVTITDIRRAGNYEPWRGIQYNDVRILRDLYWPRIAIDFKLTRDDGSVVAEGQRVLSDPSYLSSASMSSEGDPLRYEKQLIDRWVRRELQNGDLSRNARP